MSGGYPKASGTRVYRARGSLRSQAPPAAGGDFAEQVDELRRRLIRGALDAAGGNQAEAARRLALSYHQFRYYHRRYASQGRRG